MRPTICAIAAAMALVLAPAAAQASGTVQVSFVQPEKFADVKDAHGDGTGNLRELKRYLEALGALHVTDGQTMSIEVLDVDLAGDIRYGWRRHEDLRVLDGGADWPRIKLRATLESAGQSARRIEQTITDMAYLSRIPRYGESESLRHEKRMLDEWFDAQFGSAAAK